MQEVTLPAPRTTGSVSVEETISKRRSVREFQARDLSLEQVSQLAWAAQGITDEAESFRAAPSAGALYPLELYLVKADGSYHYVPKGHTLRQVSAADLRGDLAGAALNQPPVRDAALDLVIAAVFRRTRIKYGARAIRYIHLEVGHVVENIHLQAVALGLGSVPVGAFDDDAVAGVLELPEDQEPIYIVSIGYPKS